MPNHPMIPPGFEHLYPSGPISAGHPQPGLKSEPRTAPDAWVDMPGTSRKRAGVPPRFFSLEDEIALLNGMMRFADVYKSNPLDHLESFLFFIKPHLDADPTILQLKSKLRKFQQKYDRNFLKEANGGRPRKLKAHERRAFELSKLVYIKIAEASAGGPSQAENVAVVASAGGPSQAENVALVASAGGPSQEETMEILSVDDVSINRTKILTIGAQLFEKGKGVDGESEWHQLRQAEFGVHLKMAELIRSKTDALNA